jgi:5-methylcytosine-specific restriction endonuclease McrA
MARRVSKKSDKVPEWSESQYWSTVRSALRSGLKFYPPKLAVLNKAKTHCIDCGRQKWKVQCNNCKEHFKLTEVQVDHITPAGTLLSYEDLPRFVETLYCGEDNLQVLCSKCHRKKTNHERGNSK